MEVIYRPWTGNTSNDMKQCIIFHSFENLQEYIARKYHVSVEDVIDGGYADQEIEDIDTGFDSSNYINIFTTNFKASVGLYASKWNQKIVDSWKKGK